jgi:DNA (cytosine-5)-methyltransferase 1
MDKIKVLNLYSGIGGNRKLWPNDEIEVTAVEIEPNIAKIYQDFFPNDKVIVADAHKYLLEHFQEFDFIWSSPPCPTHSRLNTLLIMGRGIKPKYPDMKLYEEILLLKHFFKGKWVVENVISFYEPLIKPQIDGRHFYWSNFRIENITKDAIIRNTNGGTLNKKMNDRGIFVKNFYEYKGDKRQIIHNCVDSKAGLKIFNEAFKEEQKTLNKIISFA